VLHARPHILHLGSEKTVLIQLARWYPTALVLSNGSVLVMGGLIGAGGADSATLEILPQIPGGSTLMFLDWLENTSPNNLYPFLHILPSGSIFVGSFELLDSLFGISIVNIQ
jgi:hypothetical protein